MKENTEIAKEITIAAIENGKIIPPGKQSYKDLDEISDFNQKRAKIIGDFYKTIAKAVNDVNAGKFEITDE